MAPYLIIMLLMIGLRDVSLRTWQNNRILLLAFFVILTVFIGFRNDVGCDWDTYSLYGGQYTTFADAAVMRDPAFHLVGTAIVKSGLPYYPWINVFTALVVMYGIYSLVKGRAENLLYLAMIFAVLIVGLSMSGIRQAIAAGFLLVSFQRLLGSRYIASGIFCLLAALFHSSAIIFLLFFILSSRFGLYTKIFLMLVMAAGFIAVIIPSEAASVAVNRYTETEVESQGALFRLGVLLIYAAIYALFLRQPLAKYDTQILRFTDFSSGAVAIMVALTLVGGIGVSSVVMDRIGLYFWPFVTFGIVATLPCLPTARRYMFAWGLQAMSLVYFITWSQLGNKFDGCYTPYQNFLFP